MAQHIEITTAHNIVIKYELAQLITRIVATAIDLIIIFMFSGLMMTILGRVPSLMYIFIFLPIAFYHLLFELFNDGQSPGKALLKIKVVSLKNQYPNTEDLVMRWIFRLIDVLLTAGTLSIMSIISTDRNQRIGDIMAGTTVIKLRPDRRVQLKDFNIMESIQHEVRYPNVTVYNDQDMLIIKDTLERLRTERNTATQKVSFELAGRIAVEQQVEIRKSEAEQFLQQVINDYIYLTR